MVYVRRRADRTIISIFRQQQEKYAEEELPEDHPEILAFLNPPDDPRKIAFDNDPDRIDILNRLRSATPAQIDTWIDTNVISVAAVRIVLKAIVKSLVNIPGKRV